MVRNSTGADSKQDYPTPPAFIAAVEARFGPICFDLAASPHNAKAARFFTLAEDSLSQAWHAIPGVPRGGLLWLNPPFKQIAPWAKKCVEEAEAGACVAFLVPASVGAAWFADHVWHSASRHHRADIYFLSGRLSFDGKAPYPKDCLLALFSRMPAGVVEVWDWRRGKGA